MPTFYQYKDSSGNTILFDDQFIPNDVFRAGNLWSWGSNLDGQFGNNAKTNLAYPVTTFSGGANWKQVSSGAFHSAGIKDDGTLWLMGFGGNGQLGTNNTASRSTPVTTFIGGNDWKQVACGYRSTAAIKTDGSLWTWGYNYYGNLGVNDFVYRSTPVTTFAGGNNWKQVACGSAGHFIAAIKTDGTLWTWGRNDSGQLGINNTLTRITPVTTFAGGNNWKQADCCEGTTGAIKNDGSLWMWGGNSLQGLGINSPGNRSTPVTTFAGGNNWKSIGAGQAHVGAIKNDGTLWTWGRGDSGQCGDNNFNTGKSTPVTTFTGGTNWKQFKGGRFVSVGIKTDGTLWTWGSNSYGALGSNVGSAYNTGTPITTFSGGNNWKQASSSYYTVIAANYIDYNQ